MFSVVYPAILNQQCCGLGGGGGPNPEDFCSGPVLMDFEGVTIGTAVGSTYTASLGITYSGDGLVQDLGGLLPPPPTVPGSKAIFIPSTGGVPQFLLTVSDTDVYHWDTITVSFYGPFVMRIQDAEGSAPFDVFFDGFVGEDVWRTSDPITLDQDTYGVIQSVAFIFNTFTGNDGFAINDIQLSCLKFPPPYSPA